MKIKNIKINNCINNSTNVYILIVAVCIIVSVLYLKKNNSLERFVEKFQNSNNSNNSDNSDNSDNSNDNNNSSPMEGRNYEETRDFIISWCQKLKTDGIFTDLDVVRCVNMFKELESGADPTLPVEAQTNNEFSFGLYDRKQSVSPDSKFVEGSRNVYIYSNDNRYLVALKSGELDLLNSVEIEEDKTLDDNCNKWRIFDLGDQLYSIMSYEENYMISDNDGSVRANVESVGPWSKWRFEKNNGQYVIKSNSWDKSLTSGNSVTIQDGSDENQMWKIVDIVDTDTDIISVMDSVPLQLEKKELVKSFYDAKKQQKRRQNEKKMNEKINQLALDKRREASLAIIRTITQHKNPSDKKFFTLAIESDLKNQNDIQRKKDFLKLESLTTESLTTTINELTKEVIQKRKDINDWKNKKIDKTKILKTEIIDNNNELAEQLGEIQSLQENIDFNNNQLIKVGHNRNILTENSYISKHLETNEKDDFKYIVIILVIIAGAVLFLIFKFYMKMISLGFISQKK